MGCICEKEEKKTNFNAKSTQHVPSLNVYNPSKNSLVNNSFNLYTPKNVSNKPNINNSYGLSSGKIIQQKKKL